MGNHGFDCIIVFLVGERKNLGRTVARAARRPVFDRGDEIAGGRGRICIGLRADPLDHTPTVFAGKLLSGGGFEGVLVQADGFRKRHYPHARRGDTLVVRDNDIDQI